VIAGLGAGLAALRDDNGSHLLVLLPLGLACAAVGLGLLTEALWAWWTGLAITALTVGLDIGLGVHDGGWLPWSGALVLFGVTALQGWMDDRARGASRHL
jgi:hypothetical protein